MSHTELSLMLLAISILLLAAIAMGRVMKLMGIPAVIGELMAGIVLGPSVAGIFFADLSEQLLSSSSKVFHSIDTLVSVGGILLLFIIGLDVRLSQMIEQRRIIGTVSVFGFVFPFSLGVLSIFLFPKVWHHAATEQQWVLPLIIGTALSITSLPVISRILLDLGLLQSRFGAIIVSSATVDDVIGWVCFAIVASFFSPELAEANPLLTIAAVLLLTIFSLGFGPTLAAKFVTALDADSGNDTLLLSATMTILFIVTALAVKLGSHAMLGAFLVGVAFSGSGNHRMFQALRTTVMSFFAPLYFVFIGLRVDIAQNFDIALVVLVISIASLGKIAGVFIGSRLAGVSARESLAIGLGMNSRGAVGIILATSAYQASLINETVYVALIIMAIATTLVSGPLMKAILFPRSGSRLQLLPELQARAEQVPD